MNVTEAAQEIGLAPWTIRKLAREGKLVGTRPGRDWDFPDFAVKSFRDGRRKLGANKPMLEMIERGFSA